MLWFDVETKRKTTADTHILNDIVLWFDVETKRKTTQVELAKQMG